MKKIGREGLVGGFVTLTHLRTPLYILLLENIKKNLRTVYSHSSKSFSEMLYITMLWGLLYRLEHFSKQGFYVFNKQGNHRDVT